MEDNIPQNTSPASEKIENNPQDLPKKQSSKSKWLIIGTLCVFALIALVGVYLLGKKSAENNSANNSNFISPTISQTNISPEPMPDTIPQSGAIYLATYQGKNVIFFRSVSSKGEYIGEIRNEDGSGNTDIDYRNLEKPIRVSLTSGLAGFESVNDFVLEGKEVYLDILIENSSSTYPNLDNIVYKISLKNNSSTEIWRNQVGSSKYSGVKGASYLDQASGNYIVINLVNCYACEGSEVGKVILNIVTKKEAYLEDIGNVKINASANTFTYQKLGETKEACEPSPGCNDGERTFMKPMGETLSAKLP